MWYKMLKFSLFLFTIIILRFSLSVSEKSKNGLGEDPHSYDDEIMSSMLQNEWKPENPLHLSEKTARSQRSHNNTLQKLERKQMDPSPDFCMNMGMKMVMYMRGFHLSTSQQRDSPLPCLVYYYNTWLLKERGQFTGAMVYSFLLALLTQGLSALRAVVVRHIRARNTRRLFLAIIYPLQQVLGYLIMLSCMMYSIELLFAVVVGVALGNRLFVKGDQPAPRRAAAGGTAAGQGNANVQQTKPTSQEGGEWIVENSTVI